MEALSHLYSSEVGRVNPFELFYSYSVDYGLDPVGLLSVPLICLFSPISSRIAQFIALQSAGGEDR